MLTLRGSDNVDIGGMGSIESLGAGNVFAEELQGLGSGEKVLHINAVASQFKAQDLSGMVVGWSVEDKVLDSFGALLEGWADW